MTDTIVNPCYDNDPLDGYTEIALPSEQYLKAFWDVDILTSQQKPASKIIRSDEAFTVRFRVVLIGELWCCISGDWCFNLGFSSIGKGTDFDLSDLVGKDKFWVKGWQGCGGRCVELLVPVPAGTIPTDYCGSLYECGGWFELHCCDRGPVVVVGMEALEEQFFFRENTPAC